MLRIRKIVHPTDFSRCARQAMAYARHLAERFSADLVLLHAVAFHGEDPEQPARYFAAPEQILDRLEGAAAARLRELAGEAGGQLETRLRRGLFAGPVILEQARDLAADLIVMGTHGWRGKRRPAWGSVAEEVVRFADRPVFTVREAAKPADPARPGRVLVPVDFSPVSRQAVAWGRDLAALFGAALDLLHVVEERWRPDFYAALLGEHSPDGLRERATEELVHVAAEVAGAEVPVATHVARGDAAAEIVDFTKASDSGMIVLASHGYPALKDLFLGTTAEKVVRWAECPVVTLRGAASHAAG